MKENQQYTGNISAIIHSTMADLHEIKVIDKQTMKKYGELCLKPVDALSPEQI